MVGDSDPADYRAPGTGQSELYGYAYRLKAQDKIAEKIGREMAEDPSLTMDTAAAKIKDTVRYTAHFTEGEFGSRAQSVIDALRGTGAAVKVKNSWPPEKGIPYKGVNAQVTRPDGFRYEVQFHTPQSQAVKDQMHKLYETQRVMSKDNPRWMELEREMIAIGTGQPTPRDANEVFRLARMETT